MPAAVVEPLVAARPTNTVLPIAIVVAVPAVVKVPGVPAASGANCAVNKFPARMSRTQYGWPTATVVLVLFAATVTREIQRPLPALFTPTKASSASSSRLLRIITPAREFDPFTACTLTSRAVIVTSPVADEFRK